ncbi:MAG: CBS domain-containing protein [Candidatus Hadarchaeales archaeon]
MRAKDIMSSPVVGIRPGDPISHAKNMLIRYRVSRLLVISEGAPVGMLSLHDIAEGLNRGGPSWRRREIDQIPVSSLMHRGVISASPNTGLDKIAQMMMKHGISSVVIAEDNRPLGMITKTDVVRHFAEELSGKLKVAALMTPDPVVVNRKHSISRILEMMEKWKIKRVIVVDGEKPIGMISERDIAFAQLEIPWMGPRVSSVRYTRKLERGGRPKARYIKKIALLTAEEIMTPDPVTVDIYDDVATAAKLMLENGISGLPVLMNGRLKGIITKTDIVRGVARLGMR